MANLVALDNKIHKALRVDTKLAEAEGAEMHLVPVVINEFLKLVVQYPIVFTKNGDTGQFMCSALMGLEEGENLFYEQGEWQGIYVPLQFSRQPFFLGQGESNSSSEQNFVVCINNEHPSLSEEKGEALFNENGEATAYLENQQNRLVQLLQGEQQTQAFIKTLIDMNLLTSISLDIKFVDDSTHKVNGLYSIDEEKLEKLNNEQLIQLKDQGYLNPIYTMLASTGQIYGLIDKKNQRIQKGAQWFQAAG